MRWFSVKSSLNHWFRLGANNKWLGFLIITNLGKNCQLSSINREINRGSIPERFLTQWWRDARWLAERAISTRLRTFYARDLQDFPKCNFFSLERFPEKPSKFFLECDGNERKMKSDHAQLPVAPPRKISEKNKKSPKNTIDPKNAQQFIENFVNQVKILISPSKFGLYLPQNNYYINLDRYRLLSVARGFSCIFQKIGPVSNFSSKNFRNLSLTMYQLEVILKFHSLFISLFYRLAKIF